MQRESTSDSNYQTGSDDCLMFQDRICVPKNPEHIQKILHEAHSRCISVHPGSTKMYNDLKQLCLVCQQVKVEHKAPSGLLQPVMIPEWKWDRVTIDFVTGLLVSSKKKDVVWLYIFEIVRLYGVPVSIILNRDPMFTLRFWKKLQEALGTTTFRPQTDGQFERVIQVLEYMLRCCVLEFKGN
ncbi:integrase [Gossypium australe]|uniref:Integrase n=1 Tax=Gossypium australe TaxID=47621 RepID=A0A5B6VNV1_9ROSI|nr:integrase [Gossypium australe]